MVIWVVPEAPASARTGGAGKKQTIDDRLGAGKERKERIDETDMYLVILFSVVLAGTVFADEAGTIIRAPGFWGPGMSTMEMIRNECGRTLYPISVHFSSPGWENRGVAPGGRICKAYRKYGYMRDFRNTGKVDIAYVEYPFRGKREPGVHAGEWKSSDARR
jgi:hypothetical protein